MVVVKKEMEKFQNLLREIFQFESSDLDFGIYRILNYKRNEIEEFIQNKLPHLIEKAFGKHKKRLSENIEEKFAKVKEK